MAFNRIIRGWKLVGRAAQARAEADPELFWNLTSDWWYRVNVRIPETKERIRFGREMEKMFGEENKLNLTNWLGNTLTTPSPLFAPNRWVVSSTGTGSVIWDPVSNAPLSQNHDAGYWDTVPRIWTKNKPSIVGRWLAKAFFGLTWVKNP